MNIGFDTYNNNYFIWIKTFAATLIYSNELYDTSVYTYFINLDNNDYSTTMKIYSYTFQ